MKYRKKPVVVDAWEITRESGPELAKMCNGQWFSLVGRGDRGEDISHIRIPTLEGDMRGDLGAYLIKGVQGEFYACKRDIFEQTYEIHNECAPVELIERSSLETPGKTTS